MDLTDNQKSVLAELVLDRMEELAAVKDIVLTEQAKTCMDDEITMLQEILNRVTKQD